MSCAFLDIMAKEGKTLESFACINLGRIKLQFVIHSSIHWQNSFCLTRWVYDTSDYVWLFLLPSTAQARHRQQIAFKRLPLLSLLTLQSAWWDTTYRLSVVLICRALTRYTEVQHIIAADFFEAYHRISILVCFCLASCPQVWLYKRTAAFSVVKAHRALNCRCKASWSIWKKSWLLILILVSTTQLTVRQRERIHLMWII